MVGRLFFEGQVFLWKYWLWDMMNVGIECRNSKHVVANCFLHINMWSRYNETGRQLPSKKTTANEPAHISLCYNWG